MGQYQENSGSSNCTLAPAGSYVAKEGATSATLWSVVPSALRIFTLFVISNRSYGYKLAHDTKLSHFTIRSV
jgi:hypothetical protein